jgi:hypothetical protein
MSKKKVVYVDEGENADWIRTNEVVADEMKVHEEVARRLKKDKP